MRFWGKKLFFIGLLVLPFLVPAQESTPAAGKDGVQKSPPTSRAQRRLAKKKWREERTKKRAEEKKLKAHHKRIQTKEVRKRMKKDKKKAQQRNENKRDFFLKRWFSRKQKGKIS